MGWVGKEAKIRKQQNSKETRMLDNKIYVLDTNVLVEDPEAIFRFENATLGIPVIVLEELDKIKIENTSRGANARLITRHLDHVRSRGSLRDGVPLDNGSTVKVLFESDCTQKSVFGFDVADNKILLNAAFLKEKGQDVVFVSKDINARVKADALGIASQDYLHGLVLSDNYYHGWQEHAVSSNELRENEPKILEELAHSNVLEVNEYVVLASKGNAFNQRVFRYLGAERFRHVKSPLVSWPISSRNIHQLMALDLLFDNDIKMVSLTGPAGTGKTFLTLLAGLHQVLITEAYQKMMIARSVVPLGHDIGFLPGDVQEKLHGWMQPIYDNVDLITHMIADMKRFEAHNYNDSNDWHAEGRPKKRRFKSRHGKHNRREPSEKEFRSLDDLVQRRKMSLEAITYMRGRSIPHQFILIDEVQNLTPHEVKTLLSRVGENSKIILAGDPYQIDVPYLDFSTNGLVVATDRFRGQSIFGTVFMPKSERSELSRLVQELL